MRLSAATISLSLTLFLVSPLSATFNAGMQWDVRTTGSDSNGGGFDSTVTAPGTDFSVQNGAQIAFTDLVIGGTTTQGTSAAHPFGATSPGNVVNVISGGGCTVQRVEILSVSGVTATFDKSLGTGASTCTANLGGGLLTVNLGVGITASLPVSGNTVWIQSGTYTQSATITFNTSVNFKIAGYQTTHNDNGTMPVITTATNSTVLFAWRGGTVAVYNITFSTTAVTTTYAVNNPLAAAGYMIFTLCKFSGFPSAIDGNGITAVYLIRTELTGMTATTAATVDNTGSLFNLYVWASNIHDNAGYGLRLTGSYLTVEHTLITGNKTGIYANSALGTQISVFNTTIANNTTDGIDFNQSALVTLAVASTILYGNTGWGINIADASLKPLVLLNRSNAYGGNGSGATKNWTAGPADVTLTASPFVGGTNFGLNSTTGGGALIKAVGFPGGFANGTTGKLDIGAVQSLGSSGGGGGAFSY